MGRFHLEGGGFIHDPVSKATRFMQRGPETNWGYELSMWVPPAAPGFTRPGDK